MKGKKLLFVTSLLMVLMVLSACGGSFENDSLDLPDNGNAGNGSNSDPGDSPSEDTGGGLPPVAAVKARELLARTVGVDIALVEIDSQEQETWLDSCLGLGGPAESCLAAEFPGWRVELSVKGEAYVARTDELGEQVRFENLEVSAGPIQILPVDPSDGYGDGESNGSYDDPGGLQPVSPGGGSAPDAAEKARLALAEKLGIAADQIDVVSFSKAEWPNGCLGLAGKDEMCTEALVPGWRVELSVEGQSYIARTDETGDLVRFE